jgi:hypothetical protein
MAERVASLLERSFGRLACDAPRQHERLLRALGDLVVAVTVDDEMFWVEGTTRPIVRSEPCWGAQVSIVTDRRTLLRLIEGHLSLSESVQDSLVLVHGALPDVVRAHDALVAYLHGAVRVPSSCGLVDALRPIDRGSRS